MAARRKVRLTPIQQAALTKAIKAREDAGKIMRAHAKQCYQCHKAISMTGDYCNTGWPLAKARARAIHAAYKAEHYPVTDDVQPPLF